MLRIEATVVQNDDVTSAAAAAAAAAGVVGGSWALSCLLQLLAARVALNKRDQAAEVFEAYSVAAMSVTAAALTPAGLGSPAAAAAAVRLSAASCNAALPMPMLRQLLALLVLLLEAAPNVRLRRQVMQLQLHAGVLGHLQAAVAATCGAFGEHGHGSSDVQAGSVCQQLLAHLLAAARQQQ
jgi:hypothetical protein